MLTETPSLMPIKELPGRTDAPTDKDNTSVIKRQKRNYERGIN